MGYIGKVKVGNDTHLVASTLFGTCSTAIGTTAKVVTCSNFNQLENGVTIHVYFTNGNTAANPTLNVNSTGAIAIKRYGTTAPQCSTQNWAAGQIVSFTYYQVSSSDKRWMMNDIDQRFDLLKGTGEAAQDKGEGVSPRYFPAKWKFDLNKQPQDGDIITIRIPCAGHTNGVYISLNNGTNYKPVSVNNTARLTTNYENGKTITLVYESAGQTNDIYNINGGDARESVAGGCWTVLNYYNTNTDTKVTDTVGTANTFYPAGKTGTGTGTVTQVFDTALKFAGTTGTTSAVGKAELTLGNATASGTANNKQGSLVIYGSTKYAHTINGAPTAARTLTLPDKGGTIAVTTDITDEKVTQTNTTGGNDYRVLLSNSANNNEETSGIKKSANLIFNPSTKTLTTTSLNISTINGESATRIYVHNYTMPNSIIYTGVTTDQITNSQGNPYEWDLSGSAEYFKVYYGRPYSSSSSSCKENIGTKDIPIGFIQSYAETGTNSPCCFTISLIGDIGEKTYIRKKAYRIIKSGEQSYYIQAIQGSGRTVTIDTNGSVTCSASDNVLIIFGVERVVSL